MVPLRVGSRGEDFKRKRRGYGTCFNEDSHGEVLSSFLVCGALIMKNAVLGYGPQPSILEPGSNHQAAEKHDPRSSQTLNDFAGSAFAGTNSSLHIATPEG